MYNPCSGDIHIYGPKAAGREKGAHPHLGGPKIHPGCMYRIGETLQNTI